MARKERRFNLYALKNRKRIETNVTAAYLAEKYEIINPWRYADKGIPAKGLYFLIPVGGR